ncbi:MAG: N-acetylmuramoyl-L-alanine amidase, partial [Actinomycetota bacterium]
WRVAGFIAFVAMALVAAGCSGAERPTLIDQGAAVGTAGADSADRDVDRSVDDEAAGGASTTSAASSTVTSTGSPASTSTTAAPGETSAPPDSTGPAPPGVGAVLSPRGVLVRVTGEVDDGYLVESPCGSPVVIPWGQPVGPIRVVIDPGHGGDEEGAVAESGLTEAAINLDLARHTAAELARRSIAVILTRNDDYRIPISRRAALADAIGPDIFISIHHNTPASAPSPIPGTEVFVQSSSEESRRLGGLLYESVVAELSQFDIEWTARTDAGVLTVLDDSGDDAYGIARYPTTPSALVEMAYLGNPKEAALLATGEYLDVAAAALADGIERYLLTTDTGSGFVDAPRIFNPSGDTGGTDGCVDPEL